MINFSIPTTLLRQMDRLAEMESRNRSEFLREAIRKLLEVKRMKSELSAVISGSAKRNNLTEAKALSLAQEAKKWARKRSK